MDTKQRERDITRVSVAGIVSNTLLGVVKVVIGIATHSIAIITDAVNNLTDTSSSIITIIGTHLANRRPNAKHPFGFGRVEYLTSLVIGLTVLFTGVELCRTSIHSIIHPSHVAFNTVAVIVLVITVVVKIALGGYTLKTGRKLKSSALIASGLDARSDAVATAATVVTALLFIWKGIDIDAWVGAFISLYIVKTGFDIIKDTVSKIVGEAASKELAAKIYDIVKADENIKGAFDLILNSYGPDYYLGSMNVEVSHDMTAQQICHVLHPLQQRIHTDLRAWIVFGIYAVDKTSQQTLDAAKVLDSFCQDQPDCQSYHGLFVNEKTHQVYVDIVANYGADHQKIADDLSARLQQTMPGYTPEITVDLPYE